MSFVMKTMRYSFDDLYELSKRNDIFLWCYHDELIDKNGFLIMDLDLSYM